jgi:hypothetical protein
VRRSDEKAEQDEPDESSPEKQKQEKLIKKIKRGKKISLLIRHCASFPLYDVNGYYMLFFPL